MDQILIEGLKVNAIIGILPHEREFEQPLLLDIILEHDIRECARTGQLDRSINYASVAQEVSKFVKEKKALLIETLAEDICEFILRNFKPQSVTLKIVKTQIILDTQGVGVRITRTLQDFA